MTVNVQTKKIRLPSKKSINLAAVNDKKINWKIMIPAIILVAAVALAFAKFAVIDRFVAEAKAESEVSALQRKINDGYDQIADFGDLVDLYAHYTYSDMTEEELSRVDRSEIIAVMDRVLATDLVIDQWNIQGNKLQVFVYGKTLQEINLVSQKLYDEEGVEYLEVKTASTDINEVREEYKWDLVFAQITVSFFPASDPFLKGVNAG